MYGCKIWTIKKAESQRIDAFELWCWRRLLRVPWTARRSNQSILKGISSGCSLEGLILKLKLQHFGHPDAKSWLIGKDSDAGKEWGQEKGTTEDEMIGWHHRPNAHGFGWTLGVGDGQGSLACCSPWDCSMPGLPVHHQHPEFTQTHWVGDAIQPSHPLSSPSPPALSLSKHQGLFKWVSSSHQVAKLLELQLQHQFFQWTPKTDFL